MKYKNVGFVEQHLEKIVVGIAVLFSAFVLWFYFLSSPYSVTLEQEGGRKLKADDIEKALLDEAKDLQRSLEGPSQLPEIKIPNYAREFMEVRDRVLVRTNEYIRIGSRGIDPDDLGGEVHGPAAPEYILAELPRPQSLVVRADSAVMLPRQEMIELIAAQEQALGFPAEQARENAVAAADQFEQFVSADLPRDFTYASVAAEWDMGKYFQNYLAIPELARVPEQRFREFLFVTDVEIQRQELDPITGKWLPDVADSGEDGVIPVPPRAVSFRQVPPDLDRELAQQLLNYIKANQAQIIEQTFPPITDARPQVQPDARIDQLNPDQLREWNKINADIARIEHQIQLQGGEVPRPQQPQQMPGSFVDPMGMFPPEFDPRQLNQPQRRQPTRTQPTRSRDQAADQQRQARIAQLVERLNQLRAQRAAIEGTLAPTPTTIPGAMPGAPTPAAPGMAPDMYGWEDPAMAPGAVPRPGVAPGTPGQPPIRNPLAPAVAPQEGPRPEQVAPVQGVVRLVAHDLTVERGKTYRYRLRARIGNPLFMQEGMQPVQRAELHNRLSRTTPWSDWSQPVTVDTGQRFFLVRATQRNNAVVEVWKLRNGRWRRDEQEVAPGDPIGRTITVTDPDWSGQVDMQTGAIVVDVANEVPGHRGGTTVQLLFLDPREGDLAMRYADLDREDPQRQRLQFELQQAGVAALGP